jgi:DNA invertase Pin-like site-specific DNA recombinase
MIYGYARVSTDDQSVEAQIAALKAAGAARVFREVAGSAKTDRAQLRRAIDQLDAGDVLIVTKLDRLARSTRDLLDTFAAIIGKQAGFRSLGDAWADITTPHGGVMLTVLGGLAEFERELIRARTDEGRARAEARGVKLGRRPKLTPHQKREAMERRARGDETLAEIGLSSNVSGWTISRLRFLMTDAAALPIDLLPFFTADQMGARWLIMDQIRDWLRDGLYRSCFTISALDGGFLRHGDRIY